MVDRRGFETYRSIDQGMLIDRADRWLSLNSEINQFASGWLLVVIDVAANRIPRQ
jgi:hypothetical protein